MGVPRLGERALADLIERALASPQNNNWRSDLAEIVLFAERLPARLAPALREMLEELGREVELDARDLAIDVACDVERRLTGLRP